eukprot:CAMPEP_0119542308 /NCGR_PEP_ID=MMETSP1344-20130328/53504_1 /TAXON_ID=236787 /ORGANISM="Florenciella parvula, Strain CCMP2471" /LENGTH=111 /DNA_ID=CAMNT_0007586501 /DNA_START=95 /DNA_END=427 /DNA_ORIENTATION=+
MPPFQSSIPGKSLKHLHLLQVCPQPPFSPNFGPQTKVSVVSCFTGLVCPGLRDLLRRLARLAPLLPAGYHSRAAVCARATDGAQTGANATTVAPAAIDEAVCTELGQAVRL